MAEIDGGGISFKTRLDYQQLEEATIEVTKHIQGLETTFGKSFDEIKNIIDEKVKFSGTKLGEIGAILEQEEQALWKLDEAYTRVTQSISEAMSAGADGGEIKRLEEEKQAILEKIEAQYKYIDNLRETSNVYEDYRSALTALARESTNVADSVSGINLSLKNLDTTSAEQLDVMLAKANEALKEHDRALKNLNAEYYRLVDIQNVLKSGKKIDGVDSKVINARLDSIRGEIAMRKELQSEIVANSKTIEQHKQKVEDNSNAQLTLRTQIRKLREEMAMLRQEEGFSPDSARYKKVQEELTKLLNIQRRIRMEGKALSHNQAQLQGVISGISGVTGAFTMMQGVMGLTASESDNLNKAMVKLQSAMAITMGLQQIANTLNKESAFRLTIGARLKEWWARVTGKQAVSEKVATKAINDNTIATKANSVATARGIGATKTATKANFSLAGSFKAIGRAIKGIPGIGWVLAAIGALVSVLGVIRREIKKVNEEQNKLAEEIANNSFQTIGVLEELSVKWKLLGGDIEAQKKFVSQNQAEFNKLKVSVDDVVDAENLLIKNKDNFIQSEIAKAKAIALRSVALEKVKELIKEESKATRKQERKNARLSTATAGMGYSPMKIEDINIKPTEVDITKHKNRIEKKQQEIQDIYKKALEEEKKALGLLEEAGMDGLQSYAENTLGALEEALKAQQEKLKTATNKDSFIEIQKNINEIQSKIDDIKMPTLKVSKELYDENLKTEKEYWDRMVELGVAGVNDYTEGSVGALELIVSTRQQALKFITDKTEYVKELTEIQKIQNKIDSLTGRGAKSSKTEEQKLSDKKKEYERFFSWVNSNNEIIAKSARSEFSALLEEGDSYLDYLQKQQQAILSIDVSKRTKSQKERLSAINDALASETKNTIINAFNEELDLRLAKAQSSIEQFKILNDIRKELDGESGKLAEEKLKILDSAEQKAVQAREKEIESLYNTYASYVDKKIEIELKYQRELALLEQQLSETKDTEERARLERAIENRKRYYDEVESKQTGDENYDQMLVSYANFEEKKQQIFEKYDSLRKRATEHGNDSMLEELDKEQAKELSSLAKEQLTESDVWQYLFSNLDELTAQQITALVDEIEKEFSKLTGVFDPVDLNEIRKKLNEAKGVLLEDNPFKQMGVAIKAIFEEASEDGEDSSIGIKKNWQDLAKATESSFDFVTNAISSADILKDAIGEVGATAISSLETIALTSIAVAEAVKTADKASLVLTIIQATLSVLQAVTKVVKSIFNAQQRRIERAVKEHEGAVKSLAVAYRDLERTLDELYGNERLQAQSAMIKNLEEQKKELEKAIDIAEKAKKPDEDKINELKEQYKDLEDETKRLAQEMQDYFLTIAPEDFTNQLSDALFDVFSMGMDMSGEMRNVVEKNVDEMVANIIRNMLKLQILRPVIEEEMKKLFEASKGSDGDFDFRNITEEALERFKEAVTEAGLDYSEAVQAFAGYFDSLEDMEVPKDLIGATKNITEETGSIIAGNMNAFRMLIYQSNSTIQQILLVQNDIRYNTMFNRHLEKLPRIVYLLENASGMREFGYGNNYN